MIGGILNNALSGLLAAQKALDVTGENISNVNTEWYVKQTPVITEQAFNNGAIVSNVARSYNQFINNQMRSSTSAYNQLDTYSQLTSQVDNLTADKTTGISSSLNSFFSAVQGVANDPTSMPARQTMLSEANNLAGHFQNMNAQFDAFGSQVNNDLTKNVQTLNGYANNIAKINDQIMSMPNDKVPNQLLDQRDALVQKMTELVNINTVNGSNGEINIYVGSGQPLVLGTQASQMSIQGSRFDSSQLALSINGQDITQQISGGKLAGDIQFRDQVLIPAKSQLGTLAAGVSVAFNQIHEAGYDLNGDAGLPLFSVGTPAGQVSGTAKDPNLAVSATYTAPNPVSASQLSSGFRLDYQNGFVFTLTDLSGNTPPQTGISLANLNSTLAPMGVSMSFNGSLNPGDSFTVHPNANVAGNFQVNPAVSPSQIAAASVSGTTGDNVNAQQLANLATQSVMQNGKANFGQVYNQLVSNVGTEANQAKNNATAQKTLLNQVTTEQQSVSGVNLDEEAANLIKYQQAYQAAGQAAAAAKNMFDTLLKDIG